MGWYYRSNWYVSIYIIRFNFHWETNYRYRSCFFSRRAFHTTLTTGLFQHVQHDSIVMLTSWMLVWLLWGTSCCRLYIIHCPSSNLFRNINVLYDGWINQLAIKKPESWNIAGNLDRWIPGSLLLQAVIGHLIDCTGKSFSRPWSYSHCLYFKFISNERYIFLYRGNVRTCLRQPAAGKIPVMSELLHVLGLIPYSTANRLHCFYFKCISNMKYTCVGIQRHSFVPIPAIGMIDYLSYWSELLMDCGSVNTTSHAQNYSDHR